MMPAETLPERLRFWRVPGGVSVICDKSNVLVSQVEACCQETAAGSLETLKIYRTGSAVEPGHVNSRQPGDLARAQGVVVAAAVDEVAVENVAAVPDPFSALIELYRMIPFVPVRMTLLPVAIIVFR